MSQPLYHLRPNKYVDRHLFVCCLERISNILGLKDHRYIGFGSYLFDDFKLIHERLDITSMISLEAEPDIYMRACYNAPYKSIKVINQSSTDFISNGEWGTQNTVIWLDYSSPSELASQFNDVAALSNIVLPGDIIKVTFNANISTLGDSTKKEENNKEYRFNRLRERIGDYIPIDVTADDLIASNYPIVLLRSYKKMIDQLFDETEADPRFFMPLFSTVYQDSHRMVTCTGVILDNHNIEKEIKKALKGSKYVNFKWDKPSIISMPDLTVKEMIEMNQLLPSKSAKKQLLKRFDFVITDDIIADSFIQYYKHYPNFQRVSF